jgi:hypothetical protein
MNAPPSGYATYQGNPVPFYTIAGDALQDAWEACQRHVMSGRFSQSPPYEDGFADCWNVRVAWDRRMSDADAAAVAADHAAIARWMSSQ